MLPVRPSWRLSLAVSFLIAAAVVAQPPTEQPPPQPGLPPAGTQKAPEWPKSIGGKSAAEWVAEFTNPDPNVRENAVKMMPGFGPDVRKVAMKPLIAVVREDTDPGVTVNATLVIATIGFNPEQKDDLAAAISAIRTRISNTTKGSVYRLHATRAIGAFGVEASAAIPTLNAIAEDPSWETRAAVATALGRLGAPIYGPPPKDTSKPPAPQRKPSTVAMDRLKTMLSDPSSAVRMEAVQGLLTIGPPHVEEHSKYPAAIEPYVKVVHARIKNEEKEPAIRIWLFTLHTMYDDRVMEANADRIADFTTREDPALKIHSLNALAMIGTKAKGTMPLVKECLKSKEPAVVANAIETMIAIGEEHRTTAILELERLSAATPDKDMKKFYDSCSTALRAGKKEFDPKKDEVKKP